MQPYPGQNHHWKSLKSYLNRFKTVRHWYYRCFTRTIPLSLPDEFQLTPTAAVLTP